MYFGFLDYFGCTLTPPKSVQHHQSPCGESFFFVGRSLRVLALVFSLYPLVHSCVLDDAQLLHVILPCQSQNSLVPCAGCADVPQALATDGSAPKSSTRRLLRDSLNAQRLKDGTTMEKTKKDWKTLDSLLDDRLAWITPGETMSNHVTILLFRVRR